MRQWRNDFRSPLRIVEVPQIRPASLDWPFSNALIRTCKSHELQHPRWSGKGLRLMQEIRLQVPFCCEESPRAHVRGVQQNALRPHCPQRPPCSDTTALEGRRTTQYDPIQYSALFISLAVGEIPTNSCVQPPLFFRASSESVHSQTAALLDFRTNRSYPVNRPC